MFAMWSKLGVRGIKKRGFALFMFPPPFFRIHADMCNMGSHVRCPPNVVAVFAPLRTT